MAFLDDLIKNARKVVGDTAKDAARGANTGIGLVQQGGSALDQAVAQALGNKKLASQFAKQQQNTFLKQGNGILGVGGASNAQNLGRVNAGQALGAGAQTGAQYAPYFAGAGGGTLTAKLGSTVSSKLAGRAGASALGKASQIGANAAIATPAFAGLDALQQAIDPNVKRFDAGQANIAGLQGGAFSAAGELAPIVGKAVVKTSAKAGKAVSVAAHDKAIDRIADPIETLNIGHRSFDNSVIDSTKINNRVSEKYLKQLSKGKDIGAVVVKNDGENGIVPLTGDAANKLAAYKTAAELADRQGVPGYGGIPTKELTGNPVRQAVTNTVNTLQRQDGFAAIPGPQAPVRKQLAYGTQVKQNSLTKGAKDGRQNVSDEVAQAVQGEHVVRNTAALDQRGQQAAQTLDSPSLFKEANDRMQVKQGTISDEDVSFINQAIERADREGNVTEATNLHDQLSEHLVANGQTSQAAILLYNRTPQGLLNKAVKDINKGTEKGHVTPELRKELQDLTDKIKAAPDDRAKQLAIAKLQKRVQDEIPQSKLQGALSVWKAGLLSSPVTHLGNVLSNATFAGLNKVSDLPASIVDKGLSAFTGQRTKTFTLRGGATGAAEGIRNAGTTLKSGIDRRDIVNSKYDGFSELNFKNPIIQGMFGDTSNGIFRLLGASDQPFYYAAAKNSLYDTATALGKTQKLSGSKLNTFVKEKVANPTKEMAQQAENDAKRAVLGEDNKLASGLSEFARKIPYGAGQVIVPFTKVPTNFLSQTLDYTPVGPVKQIIQQISSKQGFNQREFSTAIGKAATGTGLIYIGSQLANNKMLSGQYPTDPKEAQRWKAEGITPNSVKIGDTWYGLNYLGPFGLLLGAGKDYQEAAARGDNAAMQSIAGLGKSLTGQSFLTGFTAFSNALQDPQRSAGSFVNSLAGSIVPNLVKSASNATDSVQRQVNNPLESIQSGIGGLRQNLLPKQDVYGNTLERRASSGDYSFNPFKPSSQQSNSVIDEVRRLHDVDKNNSDLQVTPTQINKSIKVNGVDVKLTDNQRYDLQKQVGQDTQDKWSKLIKTPEYKSLNDVEKAAALNKLRTDTSSVTQRAYVERNGLATYNKDQTKNQQLLSDGTKSINDYAKKKDEKVATTKKTTATKKTSTKKVASSTKSRSSSSKSTMASYSKQASLASRASEIASTARLANIAKSAKLSSNKVSFQNKVKKQGLKAFSKGNTQKVKTR